MRTRRKVKNPKRLGDLLAKARISADYSQQELADGLGISRNTLASWEDGYSSPSLDDILDLFNILGESPNPYLNEYVHPNSNSGNKDEYGMKRKKLHQIIDELPNKAVDDLLFLMTGDYGSFYAYMQLCIANAQTPLYDRQIVAKVVENNYVMNSMKGTLLYTDKVKVDLDALDSAIEIGSMATVKGQQKYAINKKSGSD